MRSQNTIELRKGGSPNAGFFLNNESFVKNNASGYPGIVNQ
jgi:hypothetical protein